jgi:DNA-binding MarR family transcriptional regulator
MQASRQAEAGKSEAADPTRRTDQQRSAILRDLGGVALHRDGAALDPDGPPGRAWGAFLRAHASLMRQLEQELEAQAGLALADFDVLIQLAMAGGRLRMTELADRTLVSRSGMTRRVARLVEEALVRRAPHADDRRGIVVELTPAGRRTLKKALPVHAGGVARHFASRLDERELGLLEDALRKITIDCSFG